MLMAFMILFASIHGGHASAPLTATVMSGGGGSSGWDPTSVASTSMSIDESVWGQHPLEASHMGSLNSLSMTPLSLSTQDESFTERELFELQSTMTGGDDNPPGDLQIGLNLIATIPCAIFYCRPEPLPGIKIVLNPDTAEGRAALGKVKLTMATTDGDLIFPDVEGVEFSGPTMRTSNITLIGPLDAVNRVLTSLLFHPNYNFFGTTYIYWTLTNVEGEKQLPTTNGQIAIVVGSYNPKPILLPLASDGILAGFTMKEQTTSPVFPGVHVSDAAGTSQTRYKIEIQSFEGKLNLLTQEGIDLKEETATKWSFEANFDSMNHVLANFSFTSTAYSDTYQGHAGFIIVVTNLVHGSSGFISAEITNQPSTPQPIHDALPPPSVQDITHNSARVFWQAVPDGFVETKLLPSPTMYILQLAQDAKGPWVTVYQGNSLDYVIRDLQFATQYYVQVFMRNEGGDSPASPFTRFTTDALKPSAVNNLHVTQFTAHTITLAWEPPSDNGGSSISLYRVTAQPTGLLGTNLNLHTMVVLASNEPSATVTGLTGDVEYTLTVTASNSAGLSNHPQSIVQRTRGPAPWIVGYVASGPKDQEADVYNAKVKLAIEFDLETNTPDFSTTELLNDGFKFDPPIGVSYSGSWLDSKTLVISILNPGSAAPRIGTATVTAINGHIRTKDGSSMYTSNTSPPLSGSFGSGGSIGENIIDTSHVPSEIQQDKTVALSIKLDTSPLFGNGLYKVVVSSISPLLPGAKLSGPGFEMSGLVVSLVGNPSEVQSALQGLTYTPHPGYTGPVSLRVQLSNAVTEELLSSVVVVFQVRPNEVVPLIDAPDSIQVVLEKYSDVSNIDFESSWISTESTIHSLTIHTSETGLARFTIAVDDVHYEPPQGQESARMTLVGTLDQLNAAINNLQVKYTFTSFASQIAFAPDPYSLTLELEDTGSNAGEEGAAATIERKPAIRTIPVHISCDGASVEPTHAVRARMNALGSSINVWLDKPVSDEYLNKSIFDCATMFNGASMALLGSSPKCEWSSTLTFNVWLGLGATIVPVLDSLTINDGALQRCVGGHNSAPGQSLAVEEPESAITPDAFISGPSTTSLCAPLVLEAVSTATGGRLPRFEWILPRNLNPNHLPPDTSSQLLQVEPEAFGDGGESFEFGLRITNFLGRTSKLVTMVVHATNLPVPLIFPQSATEQKATCSDSISIYNSIQFNPCFSTMHPDQPLIFRWSLTPSLPAGHNVQLDGANLVIPSFLLAPADYIATLRVARASNPTELYTEQKYTIQIHPADLHAIISGGSWRKVRVDADGWELDGSRSYDPDARAMKQMAATDSAKAAMYADDQYTSRWRCNSQTGGACFSALTGQPLQWTQSTKTLKFKKGELNVGVYVFTLTYVHMPTARSDVATSTISIREGSAGEDDDSSIGTVDVLLDGMESNVNPNGRIRLSASLPDYFAGPTDDLVYQWEVSGGSGLLSLYDISNVQGLGTRHLIVNAQGHEGVLESGADYHFKVTVYHSGDPLAAIHAGQAMVSVRVNSQPVCSSLSVAPSDGAVAFDSSFIFRALSCFDNDVSDLLSYQYFRIDGDGQRFMLTPPTLLSRVRVTMLPTGTLDGNGENVGVIVSDGLGARAELTNSVSVAPRAAAGSITQLQTLFLNTWIPQTHISGDTLALMMIIGAVESEVNALSTPSADPVQIIAFKRALLDAINSNAALLPSLMVVQSLRSLVSKIDFVDIDLMASVLNALSARLSQEHGVSDEGLLLKAYYEALIEPLQFVMATGGSGGGATRRLLSTSMDSAVDMGHQQLFFASSTGASVSPMALIDATMAALNNLARDISTYTLTIPSETVHLQLDGDSHFVGAVGRGRTGEAVNISSLDGFSVLLSETAFKGMEVGSLFDVALFISRPPIYLTQLPSSPETQSIISGGASVSAFTVQPNFGGPSQSVSSWGQGDLAVEIPFDLDLNGCIDGNAYRVPQDDEAAPGNVFGNLCLIGCKVWTGSAFEDSPATTVAMHPLSKKVVCGITKPGMVVATRTILDEPFVIPPDGSDSGPAFQQNGLPIGVVRTSMMLDIAPVVFDERAFRAQLVEDMTSVLEVPHDRVTLQATSKANGQTTLVYDFEAPTEDSTISSDDMYVKLLALTQPDIDPTVYLKHLVLTSITRLCDDGTYSRRCVDTSASFWERWELPIIVGGCCLVALLLLILGTVLFIRMRRRRAAASNATDPNAPVMSGVDLIPAKKFVYTAPSSVSGALEPSEQLSEVTVLAKGQEFEPSTHSVAPSHVSTSSESSSSSGSSSGSGSSPGEDGGSVKHRLSARFPHRSPSGRIVVSGGSNGEHKDRDDSKSSAHHFYYVDESRVASRIGSGSSSSSGSGSGGRAGPAATPSTEPNSTTSRRQSRSGSLAFTLDDDRNELSMTSQTLSHSGSGSGSGSPTSRGRAGSGGEKEDKTFTPPGEKKPLAVLRPGTAVQQK